MVRCNSDVRLGVSSFAPLLRLICSVVSRRGFANASEGSITNRMRISEYTVYTYNALAFLRVFLDPIALTCTPFFSTRRYRTQHTSDNAIYCRLTGCAPLLIFRALIHGSMWSPPRHSEESVLSMSQILNSPRTYIPKCSRRFLLCLILSFRDVQLINVCFIFRSTWLAEPPTAGCCVFYVRRRIYICVCVLPSYFAFSFHEFWTAGARFLKKG